MLKLSKYLKPYRAKLVLLMIVLLLQVSGTLFIPTLTAVIVNEGVVAGNLQTVWKTGLIMLAVSVTASGISLFKTYLSSIIFGAMERDIRNDLFTKSQRLSISDFISFGTGSMIVRCTNDVSQIKQAYISAFEMMLPAPIMSIVGLILAFQKSPSLAMLIVVSMLISGDRKSVV